MEAERRHQVWTNAETEKILNLAKKSNYTLKKAANIHGRSLDSITNRLYKVGISPATLEPISKPRGERIRRNRSGNPIETEDLKGFKLNVGSKYRITVGDQRLHGRNEVIGVCIRNYDNFVRFEEESGVSTCYLKSDLITNPTKVKEI